MRKTEALRQPVSGEGAATTRTTPSRSPLGQRPGAALPSGGAAALLVGPPVICRPTGSEAARGSGGASASWMLFMKLSSEVTVGTPVWLAAHRVPRNEAPSAPGLTEGPGRAGPRAKHTAHHLPQGHSQRVSCGVSTRLHLLFTVFPVFPAPCDREPPQLPLHSGSSQLFMKPPSVISFGKRHPLLKLPGEPARWWPPGTKGAGLPGWGEEPLLHGPEHRAPGGRHWALRKAACSEANPQSPALLHIQGSRCSNHV